MADRLAPDVFHLHLGGPRPFGANAYLVDDGEVTMIDTGLPMSSRRIEREVADAGFSISAIDRVLITHYDLDHVGGLFRLAPRLDAPVYVGEIDLGLMTGSWHPPLVHHKGLFHRGLRRLFRPATSLSLRPVQHGDRIGSFVALHTPGHNPGHMVYIHAERRAAMLGDLVWEYDGELEIPIWLDSYDMATIRESVRQLAESATSFDVACVGHGTPIREGGAAALETLVTRLPAESDWIPTHWLP